MSTQTSDTIVKDGVHYHQFDIVIVGAGGAGAREADNGRFFFSARVFSLAFAA